MVLYSAGEMIFSGTQNSVLLKAISGECCVPRNIFAPCVVRRYTCLPHRLPPCLPNNEIDYGKINVETQVQLIQVQLYPQERRH